MTNEESIEKLLILKREATIDAYPNKYVIALDMAIKALKYQGCGCGLCLAHNNMICPILKEEKDVL